MQLERFEPGRRTVSAPRNVPRVDRSWLPAGALLAAHLAFAAYSERSLGSAILRGLLAALVVLGGVFVHTLAHHLVAWLTHSPAGRSRMFIFGDVTDAPRSAAVAIAGPLASAAVGAALLAVRGSLPEWGSDVARSGALTSFGIAALNILPGLPLDGGHILAALTRRRLLAMRVGQLFGLVALAGGVWTLSKGPTVTDDSAFGMWLVLAGVFVLVEARTKTVTMPRVALEGETAGSWARPFAGRVMADDPVPVTGGPFAVSDGSRLAGVVAYGGATNPSILCRDVMVPWTSDIGVRSATPLRTALDRLTRPDATLLIVVDEEGVVRGVLDEEAVRSRMTTV